MAGSTIKGITIEIGGDTKGLTTALRGVNKDIKDTQADLKDVEKALKLDPSNVELLEQKQKLLNKAVEETSKKLETLKEAQKQAQDQLERGEISQEQYDALTREIIKTEDALKKAESAAGEFNVTLTRVQNGADKLASATGKLADKTKALSGAAAGVVTGLAGLAYNAITSADDLNTLSKQTGLTTSDIQKMQYASDLVDVSFENISGSIKKLRKNMDSNSKDVQAAWESIGVAVKDSDGNFRDSTEVFYEVLEGLSAIENETERDIIAMQLFGKSADQLAGIIDDGGKALKDFGTYAEETGMILDQETLDSLNEFNDQFDVLKATFKSRFLELGAKAMEALAPVFDTVTEAVGRLLDWLSTLDASQVELEVKIAAVVAAISPIAGIVSKISSVVSGVVGFLPKIIEFAAANPIVLIAAAVAGLAALIYEHWDKIKPVLEEIGAKVKEIFSAIVDFVKERINMLLSVINLVIKGINFLIDGLNKIQFDIPEWVPLIGGKHFGINIPHVKEIPMLATGGTILNNGAAIVGEQGAELVRVNQGRAEVTPLQNVTATLDKGSLAALGGNQNVVIRFDGSLAQLARVLQPSITYEANRRGVSLTNI